MRDIIDERDRREKMQKSVVKYWNVRYSPVRKEMPEASAAIEEEPEEQPDLAAELLRRQAEAKRKVVQDAIEEDAIERDKIDKILHEKSEKIKNIVDHKGNM